MSRTLLQRSVVALIATTLACGGSSGDITGTAPLVGIAVDADSQATPLGEVVEYTFHFTSLGGFHGTVAYTIDSLPASWGITYSLPTPLVLASGGSADLTVNISIPTDAEPAVTGRGLSLHATTASQDARFHFVLTVVNQLTFPIGLGTVGGPHWGAFLDQTVNMRVGATLTFRNDDSVAHTIHTNSAIPGLPHEPDPGMAPFGGTYSSTITGTGDDDIYCHAHGDVNDKFHVHVGP